LSVVVSIGLSSPDLPGLPHSRRIPPGGTADGRPGVLSLAPCLLERPSLTPNLINLQSRPLLKTSEQGPPTPKLMPRHCQSAVAMTVASCRSPNPPGNYPVYEAMRFLLSLLPLSKLLVQGCLPRVTWAVPERP
jgi:hypothetical protein